MKKILTLFMILMMLTTSVYAPGQGASESAEVVEESEQGFSLFDTDPSQYEVPFVRGDQLVFMDELGDYIIAENVQGDSFDLTDDFKRDLFLDAEGNQDPVMVLRVYEYYDEQVRTLTTADDQEVAALMRSAVLQAGEDWTQSVEFNEHFEINSENRRYFEAGGEDMREVGAGYRGFQDLDSQGNELAGVFAQGIQREFNNHLATIDITADLEGRITMEEIPDVLSSYMILGDLEEVDPLAGQARDELRSQVVTYVQTIGDDPDDQQEIDDLTTAQRARLLHEIDVMLGDSDLASDLLPLYEEAFGFELDQAVETEVDANNYHIFTYEDGTVLRVGQDQNDDGVLNHNERLTPLLVQDPEDFFDELYYYFNDPRAGDELGYLHYHNDQWAYFEDGDRVYLDSVYQIYADDIWYANVDEGVSAYSILPGENDDLEFVNGWVFDGEELIGIDTDFNGLSPSELLDVNTVDNYFDNSDIYEFLDLADNLDMSQYGLGDELYVADGLVIEYSDPIGRPHYEQGVLVGYTDFQGEVIRWDGVEPVVVPPTEIDSVEGDQAVVNGQPVGEVVTHEGSVVGYEGDDGRVQIIETASHGFIESPASLTDVVVEEGVVIYQESGAMLGDPLYYGDTLYGYMSEGEIYFISDGAAQAGQDLRADIQNIEDGAQGFFSGIAEWWNGLGTQEDDQPGESEYAHTGLVEQYTGLPLVERDGQLYFTNPDGSVDENAVPYDYDTLRREASSLFLESSDYAAGSAYDPSAQPNAVEVLDVTFRYTPLKETRTGRPILRGSDGYLYLVEDDGNHFRTKFRSVEDMISETTLAIPTNEFARGELYNPINPDVSSQEAEGINRRLDWVRSSVAGSDSTVSEQEAQILQRLDQAQDQFRGLENADSPGTEDGRNVFGYTPAEWANVPGEQREALYDEKIAELTATVTEIEQYYDRENPFIPDDVLDLEVELLDFRHLLDVAEGNADAGGLYELSSEPIPDGARISGLRYDEERGEWGQENPLGGGWLPSTDQDYWTNRYYQGGFAVVEDGSSFEGLIHTGIVERDTGVPIVIAADGRLHYLDRDGLLDEGYESREALIQRDGDNLDLESGGDLEGRIVEYSADGSYTLADPGISDVNFGIVDEGATFSYVTYDSANGGWGFVDGDNVWVVSSRQEFWTQRWLESGVATNQDTSAPQYTHTGIVERDTGVIVVADGEGHLFYLDEEGLTDTGFDDRAAFIDRDGNNLDLEAEGDLRGTVIDLSGPSVPDGSEIAYVTFDESQGGWGFVDDDGEWFLSERQEFWTQSWEQTNIPQYVHTGLYDTRTGQFIVEDQNGLLHYVRDDGSVSGQGYEYDEWIDSEDANHIGYDESFELGEGYEQGDVPDTTEQSNWWDVLWIGGATNDEELEALYQRVAELQDDAGSDSEVPSTMPIDLFIGEDGNFYASEGTTAIVGHDDNNDGVIDFNELEPWFIEERHDQFFPAGEFSVWEVDQAPSAQPRTDQYTYTQLRESETGQPVLQGPDGFMYVVGEDGRLTKTEYNSEEWMHSAQSDVYEIVDDTSVIGQAYAIDDISSLRVDENGVIYDSNNIEVGFDDGGDGVDLDDLDTRFVNGQTSTVVSEPAHQYFHSGALDANGNPVVFDENGDVYWINGDELEFSGYNDLDAFLADQEDNLDFSYAELEGQEYALVEQPAPEVAYTDRITFEGLVIRDYEDGTSVELGTVNVLDPSEGDSYAYWEFNGDEWGYYDSGEWFAAGNQEEIKSYWQINQIADDTPQNAYYPENDAGLIFGDNGFVYDLNGELVAIDYDLDGVTQDDIIFEEDIAYFFDEPQFDQPSPHSTNSFARAPAGSLDEQISFLELELDNSDVLTDQEYFELVDEYLILLEQRAQEQPQASSGISDDLDSLWGQIIEAENAGDTQRVDELSDQYYGLLAQLEAENGLTNPTQTRRLVQLEEQLQRARNSGDQDLIREIELEIESVEAWRQSERFSPTELSLDELIENQWQHVNDPTLSDEEFVTAMEELDWLLSMQEEGSQREAASVDPDQRQQEINDLYAQLGQAVRDGDQAEQTRLLALVNQLELELHGPQNPANDLSNEDLANQIHDLGIELLLAMGDEEAEKEISAQLSALRNIQRDRALGLGSTGDNDLDALYAQLDEAIRSDNEELRAQTAELIQKRQSAIRNQEINQLQDEIDDLGRQITRAQIEGEDTTELEELAAQKQALLDAQRAALTQQDLANYAQVNTRINELNLEIRRLDAQIENTDDPNAKAALEQQKKDLEFQRERLHARLQLNEGFQELQQKSPQQVYQDKLNHIRSLDQQIIEINKRIDEAKEKGDDELVKQLEEEKEILKKEVGDQRRDLENDPYFAAQAKQQIAYDFTWNLMNLLLEEVVFPEIDQWCQDDSDASTPPSATPVDTNNGGGGDNSAGQNQDTNNPGSGDNSATPPLPPVCDRSSSFRGNLIATQNSEGTFIYDVRYNLFSCHSSADVQILLDGSEHASVSLVAGQSISRSDVSSSDELITRMTIKIGEYEEHFPTICRNIVGYNPRCERVN